MNNLIATPNFFSPSLSVFQTPNHSWQKFTLSILTLMLLFLASPQAFAQGGEGYHSTDPDLVKALMKPQLATKDVEFDLVFVKGGEFYMGCSGEGFAIDWEDTIRSECSKDETPHQKVVLSDYSIGQYEVTQEQWEHVMGNNPSEHQRKDYPVTNITWHEAQEFCEKLSNMTGKKVRLPTEAEWEYAAKGGNKSEGFYFTKTNSYLEARVDYAHCSDGVLGSWQRSDPEPNSIGSKKPNELDIYDILGNVEEWCADWYNEDAYKDKSRRNPKGPSGGVYRVVRGGSYYDTVKYLYLTNRSKAKPREKSRDRGFRIVVED